MLSACQHFSALNFNTYITTLGIEIMNEKYERLHKNLLDVEEEKQRMEQTIISLRNAQYLNTVNDTSNVSTNNSNNNSNNSNNNNRLSNSIPNIKSNRLPFGDPEGMPKSVEKSMAWITEICGVRSASGKKHVPGSEKRLKIITLRSPPKQDPLL